MSEEKIRACTYDIIAGFITNLFINDIPHNSRVESIINLDTYKINCINYIKSIKTDDGNFKKFFNRMADFYSKKVNISKNKFEEVLLCTFIPRGFNMNREQIDFYIKHIILSTLVDTHKYIIETDSLLRNIIVDRKRDTSELVKKSVCIALEVIRNDLHNKLFVATVGKKTTNSSDMNAIIERLRKLTMEYAEIVEDNKNLKRDVADLLEYIKFAQSNSELDPRAEEIRRNFPEIVVKTNILPPLQMPQRQKQLVSQSNFDETDVIGQLQPVHTPIRPMAFRPVESVIQAPSTRAPVVSATIAQAPVPVVHAPVVQAPVVQAPVVQAPVAQAPQAPVTRAPVAQEPIAQTPVAQAPVAQAPVGPAPVVQARAPIRENYQIKGGKFKLDISSESESESDSDSD